MKKKVVGIGLLLVIVSFLYAFAQDDVFISNQSFDNVEMSERKSHEAFSIAPEVSAEGSYVIIDNTAVQIELADTPQETQKGLSGQMTLDQDSGMLFIFPKPDYYRFWMPDMNFPLDIIWINGGKVVDIHENVSNIFDPANPKIYSPKVPARYVLEVNAGFVKRTGIKEADSFVLYK